MAMVVVHGIDALEPSLGRLLIVVGVFDGLHRGHAYLLEQLVLAARRMDARPAVITFDHHPDEILTGHAPPLLCDPDERLERLALAGVAVTVVQPFDLALRETPFSAFVRRIADRILVAGFVMTPDSAFGYQRAGTPATVAELGAELGYQVIVVPQFHDGRDEVVSSGAIRAAIAQGDIANANRLLGRDYAVVGATVAGPVEGRCELVTGLPVALPPPGTYPVRIQRPGGPPDDRTFDELVIDEAGRLAIRCDRERILRVVFDVDDRLGA
jgi:riboflavin kinase/FMN adenylyltransferase